MDIDELKKQWQSMELRIEKLEEENHRLMSSISSNRVAGLRGRLLTRYCMMIIVCIISPVWLLLLPYGDLTLIMDKYGDSLTVYFSDVYEASNYWLENKDKFNNEQGENENGK